MSEPLSERQESVLRMVVETHIESGQPVGSKHLAGRDGLDFSASTVRYELARLEQFGYLNHPHTSAGRVPTDRGYRYYVDTLGDTSPAQQVSDAIAVALASDDTRREVDSALRRVADAVAQTTNLLGVVTAPPIGGTTIRRVDVLAIQPHLVMVLVITSTGEVSKRVVQVEQIVDQRMADWAAEVLNELVGGLPVGSRKIGERLRDPGFSPREASLLGLLSPALTELDIDEQEGVIYVGGQAQLVAGMHGGDVERLDALMRALEERYALLALLRGALARNQLYMHIGDELPAPALRGFSMIAANYGVPRRNLGTVSVFGPTRMDYRQAIATVREAAQSLSTYVEEVFG